MSKKVLVIVLLLLAMAVPSAPVIEAHGDDAGVIAQWNALLQDTINTPVVGLQAPRYYAMLHIAMFDAVNSIEERYRPYRVRVHASHGASSEAAAAQAAHDVLGYLIPASLPTYDEALEARLATIPRGQARQGVRVGKKVAEEILAWRLNDGWQVTPPPYVLPLLPGLWQPTAMGQVAGFTQYRGVKPFALLSPTQFLPPNPPTLTSPEYAADFIEVKDIGKSDSTSRTADQTLIARLFAGGAFTPTTLFALWSNVARDSAESRGLRLVETARLFALMFASINDGLQTSQTSKFVFGLWRPVTAIKEAAYDLNELTVPHDNWATLIPTPPYPAYAGNMACVGASAATALALGFDSNDVPFNAVWRNPSGPDYVRPYDGFWELAVDQANSRVYGGIHFRFDNEASQQVCPKVAKFVFDNYMRPRDHHGWPW